MEQAPPVRHLLRAKDLVDARILGADHRRRPGRASYDELAARGVEFTETPHAMPYGIDCGFRDPSGNSVRLTQLAELPTSA